MIPIQELLVPFRGNRTGTKRTLRSGVCIHYTGNADRGAGAKASGSYVGRNGYRDSKGSMREMDGSPFVWGAANYYIDDKNIIMYIPVNEYAAHAGANTYMPGIISKIGGSPNLTLDSIEICINPESNFLIAVDNAAQLAAMILKKDNLGVDHLYRHYDMTGKICPAMMVTPNSWKEMSKELNCTWISYYPWESFVAKVKSYIDGSSPIIAETPYNVKLEVTAQILNVRDSVLNGNIIKQLNIGTIVQGISKMDGWIKVNVNGLIGYCSDKYIKEYVVPVSNGVGVVINEKLVAFSTVKPKLVGGSYFVPIKEVLETEGFKTTWDSKKDQAIFSKSIDGKNIALMIDIKTASIYGQESKTLLFWNYNSWVKINSMVSFELDRTLIQVRPVFEAIGFTVSFDITHNFIILKG